MIARFPFELVEYGFTLWLHEATGLPINAIGPAVSRSAEAGAGPVRRVTIELLQAESVSRGMVWGRQGVTEVSVQAVGGAEVGLDFYPGFEADPISIFVPEVPGDLHATAQALLAQLELDLPAGYSAQLGHTRVTVPIRLAEGYEVPQHAEVLLAGDTSRWRLVGPVFEAGDAVLERVEPGAYPVAPGATWSIAEAHQTGQSLLYPGWNAVGANVAAADLPTDVLIRGSELEPLFGAVARDGATLSYRTSFYEVLVGSRWHFDWRFIFRARGVSSHARAVGLRVSALHAKAATIDAKLAKFGLYPLGILAEPPMAVYDQRGVSEALLDIRYQADMVSVNPTIPVRIPPQIALVTS